MSTPPDTHERLCKDCKETRPSTEFQWLKSKRYKLGGHYASYCKACKKIRSKATHQKHGDNYKAKAKIKRKEQKRLIESLKEAAPCADCGHYYPYWIMQFDHVRGEKRFEISKSGTSQAKQTLLEEIKKCDIVCANCHQNRTYHEHHDKPLSIYEGSLYPQRHSPEPCEHHWLDSVAGVFCSQCRAQHPEM